jgi:hypothetical protein
MGERNTSQRQPSSPRERVEALLAVAAQIWVDDVQPPTATTGSYSTAQNEFLWAAEGAWFDAAGLPKAPG